LIAALARNATEKRFKIWRFVAKEHARDRDFTTVALKRLNRALLAKALGQWSFFLKQGMWLLAKSRKFYARLARASVARAYGGWRGVLTTAKVSNRLVARFLAGKDAGRKVDVFRIWKYSVLYLGHKQKLVNVCHATIESKLKFKAVQLWKHEVGKAAQRRLKLKICLGRMKRHTSRKAFAHWQDMVRAAVVLKRKVGNLLGRTRRAKLDHAFSAWDDLTRARKERSAALGRTVSAARMRAVVAEWAAAATRLKAQNRVVRRCVARLRAEALLAAFDAWFQYKVDKAQREVLVGKLIQRWMSRSVAMAFDAWVESFATATRQRRLVLRLLTKVAGATLRHAFAAWAAVRTEARWELRRKFAAVRRYFRGLRARALRAWGAEAQRRAARRRLLQRAMFKTGTRRAALVFEEWLRVAGYERRFRGMVAKALARSATASAWRALRAWGALAREQLANVERVRRCVTSKRVTQKVFLSWYFGALDEDVQGVLGNLVSNMRTHMEHYDYHSLDVTWTATPTKTASFASENLVVDRDIARPVTVSRSSRSPLLARNG